MTEGGKPSDQPQLLLNMLGGLGIALGSRPVGGFVSSKSKALLCYLALTRRPVARESLAALLWGDMPEEAARASLRQAISNLQRLVGSYLLVTRQTIGLDPASRWWADANAFLDTVQHAEGITAHTLREAAELYAGDLLAGFHVRDTPDFEEWLAGERERLRQVALQALHDLSVRLTAQREYTAASDYLGRLLALDPWREDAHRQRMLLLARSGRQDAALAQYEVCKRVLREELGEEPSDETTALYDRIRSGNLGIPTDAPTAVVQAPTRRHSVPIPPTPLFGRQRELTELMGLLRDPASRLINVVGPGGVGKTHLALAVAGDIRDEFGDGVSLVEFASIDEAGLATTEIARALGVPEVPGTSMLEALKGHLADKHLLLVLENFERLVDAAPLVAEILGTSPHLRILATSRTRLHLLGERVYIVDPLAVPSLEGTVSDEEVSESPAVTMFVSRAGAARPGFALTEENVGAILAICRRLDGLPLAIELAAARMDVLSPRSLLSRLESGDAVLTGGARDLPGRHRTLRATMEWSYNLLSEPERKLFRRLSVFAGGWTLEGAEAVCVAVGTTASAGPVEMDPLSGLASLVDKSLVRRQEAPDGELRFGMLETIRGYAREVLDWAGNLEAVGRRHAGYFLELAETAERELRGGKQAEWLRRLEAEHDNLRVALNWAHERGEAHLELRLAGALGWFWLLRGYFTEGRTILRRTLSGTGGAPDARAKALAVEGMLAWRQGDLPRASSLLQDALALYEGLGDSVGAAHARHHLAHVHEARGDLTGAARLFEESLDVFRGCDDTWGLVLTLNCLGDALARRGDHERATALIEEGLTRATGAGDRHGMADALRLLGSERLHAGDDKRAVALLRESLALCRSLGDRQGTALSLRALTTASIQRGDYATARALAAESLRLAQEMGDGQGSIGDLATLAAVARREERFDHAATLLGTADALLQRLGASLSPCAQAESDRTQAVVRAHLGDDGFSARYGEGQALSLEEAAVRRLATER